MIRIEQVTKDYGEHRALSNVTFHIQKGEIVGLLGPNGAGKTTMMRIITGFLPATEGDVFIHDFEVHEDPMEVKRRIGYMPENIALYPEMRVRDYLDFSASLKQIPEAKRKRTVDMAMEQVRLHDRERFIIGRLSKGYRQRVGLAQAILHDPEILILDEPTAGLDPKQIVEIRSLIRSLSGNRTVILSTHILPEVQQTCERAVIINRGRVIAEDSISGLKQKVEEEIKGSNILVRLTGDEENAINDLRKMVGVVSAKTGEENTILIESEGKNELRPKVAEYLVKKGYEIIELRAKELDLEEVFLHLTKEQYDGERR